MLNEARYIQSYAKIIGVKEEAAISYARKKETLALINNASGLLTTKTQREKHKAFVDLYRMSSELHHENPVLSSPEAVTSFMQSVMEHIHDKEAMMAVFLDSKNRVIDYEENKSALSVSSFIKETGTNYEVTDAPFEAFITNLGKYNEGELVGEWVAFPTDRESLQEVFKRIGIGSENELGTVYEEIFISDYDCRIGNLYNVLGEYESLNELKAIFFDQFIALVQKSSKKFMAYLGV